MTNPSRLVKLKFFRAMDKDELYMRMAIKLARKGAGLVHGLPMVGAVVVVDDRIAGNGFAGSHDGTAAVIAAINEAGPLGICSTIYTNCEPLIDSTLSIDLENLIACRPARIVVGAMMNPDRADETLARLRKSGIDVTLGVCQKRCREINEIYLKYSDTGLPFVTVKYAQTLDGRIATSSGDSQWISSPPSLRLAHQLRREHDAIMVGIGTVLKDDPRLTVRLVGGRDPLRIVIDSQLRIHSKARVITEKTDRPTLIITNDSSDRERVNMLTEIGAEVLIVPRTSDSLGVDITEAISAIGRRAITSVLVEGGSGIITSLLAAQAVDRLVVVTAPKIVGRGIEAVDNLGITRLTDAITFSSFKTRRIGPDTVFDGRMQRRESADQDL